MNSAFRPRTKTQGAYPNEDAALVLLYALFATGQIRPRKIDGWKGNGRGVIRDLGRAQ